MEEIQKILTAYKLVETSPVYLLRESSDNKVFVVGEKDKKILRISKRLPVEDIGFEFEAVQHFLQRGLPLPVWKLTNSGDFYALSDGMVAVMFDFLKGRHI